MLAVREQEIHRADTRTWGSASTVPGIFGSIWSYPALTWSLPDRLVLGGRTAADGRPGTVADYDASTLAPPALPRNKTHERAASVPGQGFC